MIIFVMSITYISIVNSREQVYSCVSIKSVIDGIKLFVYGEYISFFVTTVFMSTKVQKKVTYLYHSVMPYELCISLIINSNRYV